MTSRRVIIGKYADSVTYGLKAALPGFDALAEADDSANLSFNSNWADIVPVLQLGIVTSVSGIASVLITDPGYVPFIECRKFDSGNTVHDDYLYGVVNQIGVAGYYNRRSPLTFLSQYLHSGDQMIYVVFATPVVLS